MVFWGNIGGLFDFESSKERFQSWSETKISDFKWKNSQINELGEQ